MEGTLLESSTSRVLYQGGTESDAPYYEIPIVIFIDLCGEEIYVNEGMKSYQDKLVAEAKRIWDALTKSMTPQTEQEKKADWWKWARSEIKSRWTERDKKLNELDKLFDNYKTT